MQSIRFGGRVASREPGARMFHAVRLRLTLWYCSVLAAALVLFGVALYFGVQGVLLNSSRDYLSTQEHALGSRGLSVNSDLHSINL